ncbi:MAG TPA: hypothetical protein VF693_07585 [Allosphingosinicella sp.]|jgi:hypothetical protein
MSGIDLVRVASRVSSTFAAIYCLAAALPAAAQSTPETEEQGPAVAETTAPEEGQTAADQGVVVDEAAVEGSGSGTDILSLRTFSLVLDGRLAGADGGPSWLDRGFGKTRFDGDRDGDFQPNLLPMQATLVWQPRFFDSLSATVSGGWQRDQEEPLDIMEAFLSFRPSPQARTRFHARAGIFWPNISLEHAGAAWSVTESITPSAINSWISEEVKVLGLEATLTTTLGEHQLSLTGAAFGFNDTSGTLLSFRGWALHDLNATVFGYFPLPVLNPFMTVAQEDRTKSFIELDDRVGFYGNLEWRPPWPFALNVFYYDNRGDPEVFNSDLQWGWLTRFWNVGFNADLGPSTRLLAQGMIGDTTMGIPGPPNGNYWVETRFRSAYVLLRHDFGPATLTGRFDWFDTREQGRRMDPTESEEGWSIMAASRVRVNDQVNLFLEALHVSSERGVRTRIGQQPTENHTVLQAGLRLQL